MRDAIESKVEMCAALANPESAGISQHEESGMHDAVTCGRAGAGGWHAFSVARMPVLGCRGAHADLTKGYSVRLRKKRKMS